MERKSKTLNEYIQIVPEKYRNNILLLEDYKGNRTNISFTFSCGCEIKQSLKAFLLRDRFDLCTDCKTKELKLENKSVYRCKYCASEFLYQSSVERCNRKCEKKYKELVFNEDYVVCNICGFHCKSLGIHITKKHDISYQEYKKRYNFEKLTCEKTSEKYKNLPQTQFTWIEKAKQNGEDLTEYRKKISEGVKEAINNNPEELKRRSELMSKINEKLQNNEEYKKALSERAKITSARQDIQVKRSAQLKNWRDNNIEIFHNKCVKKMLKAFQSKPEIALYKFLCTKDNFSFKRNQFIHSNLLTNKSSKKQIDIGDKNKRIYIEFDGILHFEPKFGEDNLERIKQKDREIEQHISKHNWTLIRVSYDQFKYSTKTINKIKEDASYFKPECLEQIQQILNDNKPGIYKIGEAYKNFI